MFPESFEVCLVFVVRDCLLFLCAVYELDSAFIVVVEVIVVGACAFLEEFDYIHAALHPVFDLVLDRVIGEKVLLEGLGLFDLYSFEVGEDAVTDLGVFVVVRAALEHRDLASLGSLNPASFGEKSLAIGIRFLVSEILEVLE